MLWLSRCVCGRESPSRYEGLFYPCRSCAQDKGLNIGRNRVAEKSALRVSTVLRTGIKRCPACQEEKPVDKFQKCSSNRDGRQSYCRDCTYFKQIKHHYGITRQVYEVIWAHQGGKCAIRSCDREIEVVDHCHDTGKVRGLLCQRCNKALTHSISVDLLRDMAVYLEDSEKV